MVFAHYPLEQLGIQCLQHPSLGTVMRKLLTRQFQHVYQARLTALYLIGVFCFSTLAAPIVLKRAVFMFCQSALRIAGQRDSLR